MSRCAQNWRVHVVADAGDRLSVRLVVVAAPLADLYNGLMPDSYRTTSVPQL